MLSLNFTTKYGIVTATKGEVQKHFGCWYQEYLVVFVSVSGFTKLRPEYIEFGEEFTQKRAEEIAYLRSPEGKRENRARLEEWAKELQS